MQKELLEECLAEGMSLEAIGKRVGKHESTVSYWLKKHGLAASGHETHAPNQKVDPERLRTLVEAGAPIQEMGEAFDVGRAEVAEEETCGRGWRSLCSVRLRRASGGPAVPPRRSSN
ncbi:MAG TPA: helix-turn-helix domain-containing protein [Solirubrobacterales bacterium]